MSTYRVKEQWKPVVKSEGSYDPKRIQSNPVNTTTEEATESVRINGVSAY